jgi:CRISPR type I-E-associated protein CasB/Cse2
MSSDINKRVERLTTALQRHKDDRGVMADLKRGFSEATADRTWPYLSKWGCDIVNDRERIIYQTVSAAYAVTKGCSTDKGNMGTVCRQLAMGDVRGLDGLETFASRFRRLLTCSSVDELCGHLIGIIKAAAAKRVSINFAQLFSDLWRWTYSDEPKLKWASEYWKVEEP